MPSLLGKRKSTVKDEPEATADAQEMLRRHFEARFKPLALYAAAAARATPKATNGQDSDDSDDSDDGQDDDSGADSEASKSGSDWGGVSDDEGMRVPDPAVPR